MGENFRKRRNDQFTRQRDECHAAGCAADLFAACPPEVVQSICGSAIGNKLAEGDELWATCPDADGPICLYLGDQKAVELREASADHVREKYTSPGGIIFAKVAEIGPSGLVILRMVKP